MRRNVYLSDDREVPILFFLWKWKVSTTAALIHKFFPNCKGKTAYNRLLSLRQAGLIQTRSDGLGQKFICTLDKRGFEAIKGRLPHTKEDGFKSENPGHDLLVSAFHLGDWLLAAPKGVELFSEQELRRIDPAFYPDWVPQTNIHRPDGYSKIWINGKPIVAAIEVELSHKRNADYATIAKFYNHYRNIGKVFWLVPRGSMASVLFQKLHDPTRSITSPHNFIIFEEFQKYGWNSCVYLGEHKGKPLSECMSDFTAKSGGNTTESIHTNALLDLRKSPHVAVTYKGYQLGDFAD